MAGDRTENWRLILEAARALTAAGQSPFTRVSVYEWIWRRHPRSARDRPSLDPTFQGMIRNAPGGPAGAAGTPLVRTGRGQYVLADAAVREQITHSAPDKAVGSRAGVVSLSEDEVKQGARDFLETAGFRVAVAWGHQRGIDIEAVSAAEVVLLEAKGSAQNPPQQVNYFLGALGELLQRMTSPGAVYGLALPDNRQYRGLVSRLPALVWERLHFTVLFVSKGAAGDYTVEQITGPSQQQPDNPPGGRLDRPALRENNSPAAGGLLAGIPGSTHPARKAASRRDRLRLENATRNRPIET